VTRITVSSQKSGENSLNSTHRVCRMSDNVANSIARLERLVTQIMREKGPVRYDQLCSQLWLVLDERERLAGIEARTGGANKATE